MKNQETNKLFSPSVKAELCSGLFSDVMDRMGYKKQIIINWKRNKNLVSFLGRARTLLLESVETDDENIRMGLSFLGQIAHNEIFVVKGSNEFAYFGELMTKLSTQLGIEGVVIDGLTRDTNYTHRSDVSLPILARGYSPVDIKGRGRVQATDVEICIGNVSVSPGDLIYSDNEAVCVVPKEIETEVSRKVIEKMQDEARITRLIANKISVDALLEQVKEF